MDTDVDYDDISEAAARVKETFPLPPVVSDDADEGEMDRRNKFAICTPRTALVLAVTLEVMSDFIIDGCDRDEDTGRYTNDELPQIARNRTYEWMTRLSNCFIDLRDDIFIKGKDPRPLCTGEEVALALAIEYARDDFDSGLFSEEGGEYESALMSLPEHPEDYDWEMLEDDLFKYRDFEMLYDAALDGIEDKECVANRQLGMINLHPNDWFKWFNNSPEDVRESRVSHRAVPDGEELHCKIVLEDKDEDGFYEFASHDEDAVGFDFLEIVSDALQKIPEHKQDEYRRVVAEVLAHGFVVGKEYEDRVKFLVEDGLFNVSGGIPYSDADGVTLYGSEYEE